MVILFRAIDPSLDLDQLIVDLSRKCAASGEVLIVDMSGECARFEELLMMTHPPRLADDLERCGSASSPIIRGFFHSGIDRIGIIDAHRLDSTIEKLKECYASILIKGPEDLNEFLPHIEVIDSVALVSSPHVDMAKDLEAMIQTIAPAAPIDLLVETSHLGTPFASEAMIEGLGLRSVTRISKGGEWDDRFIQMVQHQLYSSSDPEFVEGESRSHDENENYVIGLGPLEEYMDDPSVSEVMVNAPDQIYVERGGVLTRTKSAFRDIAQMRIVIDRIVSPIGRRVDESSPVVDARLPDGSRVHVVVPPLSLDSPIITIRKFTTNGYAIGDLVRSKSLSNEMADYLMRAVSEQKNILISGGTGSGKTTILNILSSFIGKDERIITIEDAAELNLCQPHVVRLESRPPNIEGRGAITIRDLVRASLRMRPDRIIVGECRGAEALDMLQAMNTGHDGSLTTIHANSCRDALSRLETLILFAGYDLPVRAIREQIVSAIDIIVQTIRDRGGSRRVSAIHEVAGLEGTIITMEERYGF